MKRTKRGSHTYINYRYEVTGKEDGHIRYVQPEMTIVYFGYQYGRYRAPPKIKQ